MARDYQIISGDSHLEVRADRWTHRVPAAYQDVAPRMMTLDDGADAIIVPGGKPAHNPMDLYGGKGRDEWRPYGERYEDTPGTGSPEQRVGEMDLDGVDAEVLYPSVNCGATVWEQIPDPEAQKAVFHAYNAWLAEEYCAAAPDRLFGVGTIPRTGLDDALAELRYAKDAGLKAVVLRAFPTGRSKPSLEDDAFWQAALDMSMPVTIHVTMAGIQAVPGGLVDFPREADIALHTDLAHQLARFGRGGASNVVQLILSGVFDRFPALHINMSENQIGWVPLFMETGDIRYGRHIGWTAELQGYTPLSRPFSEYVREHFYWGFQQDTSGVELRHHMGVDRLIWGSDFPHVESEWPHSKQVLEANFAKIPADETSRMLCGNAREFFGI
jgi:predicted TIM-barrel fold metal-dependent hydrolase